MDRRAVSTSTEIRPGDRVRVNPGGVGAWLHVHVGDDGALHLYGDAEALAETLSDALTGVQSFMDTQEENG
jgi:hypothetical protein